jgi:hypothetical protein
MQQDLISWACPMLLEYTGCSTWVAFILSWANAAGPTVQVAHVASIHNSKPVCPPGATDVASDARRAKFSCGCAETSLVCQPQRCRRSGASTCATRGPNEVPGAETPDAEKFSLYKSTCNYMLPLRLPFPLIHLFPQDQCSTGCRFGSSGHSQRRDEPVAVGPQLPRCRQAQVPWDAHPVS